MKVKIEIECEDERELLGHLFVIRRNLKKAFKKKANNRIAFTLKDSNCYGDHWVRVSDRELI